MSKELARYYIEEAKDRLSSARRAFKACRYGTSIFYAQECAEFAVKGAMETLSIKYPPIHDVGDLVLKLGKDERLPDWFRRQAPRAAEIVSRLADRRIIARYGDQLRKIPPSRLFDRNDAERAIADAEGVYKLSCKFLKWWLRE